MPVSLSFGGSSACVCIVIEAILEPLIGHAQDAKRDMRSALSRSALLGELRVKKVIDLVPEPVRRIHGPAGGRLQPPAALQVRLRAELLFFGSSVYACILLLGSRLYSTLLPCSCTSLTDL